MTMLKRFHAVKKCPRSYVLFIICILHSRNARAAQIRSKCDDYLLSVDDIRTLSGFFRNLRNAARPQFCKMDFVNNLLNNKTVILLNLTVCCLVLFNSA